MYIRTKAFHEGVVAVRIGGLCWRPHLAGMRQYITCEIIGEQ